MHYGTFHRGTPRVSDAQDGASDFDIYISANDVSETHFHIYAYKYTARKPTGMAGTPQACQPDRTLEPRSAGVGDD